MFLFIIYFFFFYYPVDESLTIRNITQNPLVWTTLECVLRVLCTRVVVYIRNSVSLLFDKENKEKVKKDVLWCFVT